MTSVTSETIIGVSVVAGIAAVLLSMASCESTRVETEARVKAALYESQQRGECVCGEVAE